ncbi:MAG: MarR family transcriptional regulator, partial [Lachnospiraceae bacterium]|nr:MarR family transcriptional regulator [Lachnospiraceae bacterium]
SALKKLEKDGYLTLCRSQEKAGKTIRLTEKGTDFVDRYIRPILKAEEHACGMFTEEEKEWFLKTYRLLTERLNQEISQV